MIAAYRAIFGIVVLVAIAAQAASNIGAGTFDLVNFLSYFTIQTNAFGAAIFLLGAARWRAARSERLDFLRGASTVYLTITFIVFALLLAGTDVDVALPWVNRVLHETFPVVVMLDWLFDPPARRIPLSRAARWLIYPVVWIVYVLVRGALVDRYPYPFLDPGNGGYGTVALYCIAICVLFVLVGGAVAWIGSTVGRAEDAVAAR